MAGGRSGPRCRLLPSFSRKGRQGKGKGQPIPCLLRCSAAPPPYLILWFLDTGLQAPAAAAPATKGGGLLPSYIISYIYRDSKEEEKVCSEVEIRRMPSSAMSSGLEPVLCAPRPRRAQQQLVHVHPRGADLILGPPPFLLNEVPTTTALVPGTEKAILSPSSPPLTTQTRSFLAEQRGGSVQLGGVRRRVAAGARGQPAGARPQLPAEPAPPRGGPAAGARLLRPPDPHQQLRSPADADDVVYQHQQQRQ